MMNFKQYFHTLLEMPQQITSIPKIVADIDQIYEWSDHLENIIINKIPLEVWKQQDGSDINLFFIHDDKILVELAFSLFGQGIKENLVIQNKEAPRGLARMIYVQYLLKKYRFILSDTTMTEQGITFWTKLWAENKDRFKFYLYDSSTKTKKDIMDIRQMREVFGKDRSMHGQQFVIVR